MAWKNFDPTPYTREQFADRVARLPPMPWCKGICLHNTAAPTLAQWAESGPQHDARLRNLQHYYEQEKGWHAGPHLFVSRDYINGFSDLTAPGVHSRCFNKTHIGIEMCGDFAREPFSSGDGAKVRDNAVFAMAVLCRALRFNPDTDIVFHKDCKLDDHDCPGKLVVKADVFARVRAEMARLGGAPAPTLPDPPKPQPTIAKDLRRRMAKAIVDYEARRDSQGRLAVYQLPPGDGGGTYEVAGINDRYHKAQVDHLVALIRAGRHQEAEDSVIEYLARYTDVAASYSTDAGVEFYLRDCCFNRGPKGAARILQRAVGVPDDGEVGPQTKRAIAGKTAEQLLVALRAAREQYERDVAHRDESSKFWRGLVNRWNNALAQARKFSAETPKTAPATKPTATVKKLGLGAAFVTAAGGVAHWIDGHPALTIGAIVIAALLALFVISKMKGGNT